MTTHTPTSPTREEIARSLVCRVIDANDAYMEARLSTETWSRLIAEVERDSLAAGLTWDDLAAVPLP